jgi:hypothetical protein
VGSDPLLRHVFATEHDRKVDWVVLVFIILGAMLLGGYITLSVIDWAVRFAGRHV